MFLLHLIAWKTRMGQRFLKIEISVNGFLNFSYEPREIQSKNTINCKRLLYNIICFLGGLLWPNSSKG